VLKIDGLSTEEVRALDAVRQIEALNDLFGETKRLADEKQREIDRHTDARIALLSDAKNVVLKASVLDRKRRIDKLSCIISARKEQTKILQTLLRSVPS
jgi:hypothetical protein